MIINIGWLLLVTFSICIIIFDVKERKISNQCCFLVALIASALNFLFYFEIQVFNPSMVLFIGVFLSMKGWLGGGDAKLFAAYSTAILPENLFLTVLLILIVGGVVSLCCLIKNKWTKSADRGVPYGVAIVIGSLFGIWMSL
ncbi:A24 family peptidase [Vibrio owensii]|uniref:A24 family peptidase n=1 Tax=Vibrio owensii TaxID=696485 RepID=UPI002FF29124